LSVQYSTIGTIVFRPMLYGWFRFRILDEIKLPHPQRTCCCVSCVMSVSLAASCLSRIASSFFNAANAISRV